MTEREEQAVVVLNTLHDNPLLSDIHRQALEVGIMAIKALSRSGNPNKWIGAEVLDKIRAEIADLDDADYDYEGYYKAVTDALQIIDKYKAESEAQE